MATKLGETIKAARMGADLTQEKLARKISGLSAEDVSAAERGEKTLTQAQLKAIAKACGVTQASLLDAAKGAAQRTATAKKATAKTTTAKAAKTPASAGITMRVTATEKKLVLAYREATGEEKKAALAVLQGKVQGAMALVPSASGNAGSLLTDVVGSVVESLLGGKK